MTTFAGWLADQRKREDAVGWFARYWRDLPSTPRLSSPASICSHLEDRTTQPGQDKAGNRLPFGFTDPDGGQHVRDAYDATLHEYRQVRAQIVQSTAEGAGVQPPLADAQQPAEPVSAGLAGQAVTRATDAAVRAAQRHVQPTRIEITGSGGVETMLAVILRKLERIEAFLGLPDDLEWASWYAQADLAAAAE